MGKILPFRNKKRSRAAEDIIAQRDEEKMNADQQLAAKELDAFVVELQKKYDVSIIPVTITSALGTKGKLDVISNKRFKK